MNRSCNPSMLLRGVVVSLGLAFLPSSGAMAATITFFDLTDTLTVTLSSDLIARGATSSCAGEVCTVTVLPPNGPAPVDWTSPIEILEPGTQNVSDIITVVPTVNGTGRATFVTIVFTSDLEVPLPGPIDGNTVVETGQLQVGTSFFWKTFDGTAIVEEDVILFQSDVEGVPEPATFALLSLGLAGLGFSRRKQ